MRTRLFVGALAVVAASAAVAPLAAASAKETAPPGVGNRLVSSAATRGHAKSSGPHGSSKSRPGTSSNGISYHGGPVATSGVDAYVIWYGNWSNDSATTILPTLLSHLGGSPYFNINTTYYDGSNRHVANAVTLSGQTNDAYSQGATNLSDGQIATIVSNAISSGRLPSDPKGVYFVLTSVDVTKSGFLSSYCGWHTHGTIGGADIKYAFVGDPGNNYRCNAQTSSSPNNNVGADAMASVVAHELEESATDPDLNAWFDQRGNENADKCAWTFGTTYKAANGSSANMQLGGLNFLVQRNWVNAGGGYCALSI
jgi:hypothetical protein